MTEPVPTDVLREIAADVHRILNPKWMAPRLTALATELDALRTATAWQPISTAPRDGRTIVIHDAGLGMTFPCHWNDDGTAWEWAGDSKQAFGHLLQWHPMPTPPETAP